MVYSLLGLKRQPSPSLLRERLGFGGCIWQPGLAARMRVITEPLVRKRGAREEVREGGLMRHLTFRTSEKVTRVLLHRMILWRMHCNILVYLNQKHHRLHYLLVMSGKVHPSTLNYTSLC